MSKIGKKSIHIPTDVKIGIDKKKIFIEGPKGKLDRTLPSEISCEVKDDQLFVKFKGSKEKKPLWGTWRSKIKNILEGVTKGFEKQLKIEGIGWRANLENEKLVLKVGFTHPVEISPPEGISLFVEKGIIKVSGVDKEKVGSIAAKIRAIRPPEPYKGKGIRYIDEIVKKKAGKKAVTTVE